MISFIFYILHLVFFVGLHKFFLGLIWFQLIFCFVRDIRLVSVYNVVISYKPNKGSRKVFHIEFYLLLGGMRALFCYISVCFRGIVYHLSKKC